MLLFSIKYCTSGEGFHLVPVKNPLKGPAILKGPRRLTGPLGSLLALWEPLGSLIGPARSVVKGTVCPWPRRGAWGLWTASLVAINTSSSSCWKKHVYLRHQIPHEEERFYFVYQKQQFVLPGNTWFPNPSQQLTLKRRRLTSKSFIFWKKIIQTTATSHSKLPWYMVSLVVLSVDVYSDDFGRPGRVLG